jgi:hypothetical protein
MHYIGLSSELAAFEAPVMPPEYPARPVVHHDTSSRAHHETAHNYRNVEEKESDIHEMSHRGTTLGGRCSDMFKWKIINSNIIT